MGRRWEEIKLISMMKWTIEIHSLSQFSLTISCVNLLLLFFEREHVCRMINGSKVEAGELDDINRVRCFDSHKLMCKIWMCFLIDGVIGENYTSRHGITSWSYALKLFRATNFLKFALTQNNLFHFALFIWFFYITP